MLHYIVNLFSEFGKDYFLVLKSANLRIETEGTDNELESFHHGWGSDLFLSGPNFIYPLLQV